jgi:hypothetical protein
VALAAGLLAVLLAGCGSSGSPPQDPATVVPASAPLYVGAIVQPSGSLKSDTVTAANKLTGSSESFGGLLKLLSPTGRQLDYDSEVKPWLGEKAGAFLTSVDASKVGEAITGSLSELLSSTSVVGAGESLLHGLLGGKVAAGAIVLDTTDAGKAQTFLQARAQEAGAHAASYRGVSYEVAADGDAEGIVDKFAVIGSEAALRSAIETEQSGPASSIAQAAGYAKLAAGAEKDALANVYVRAGGLPALGGLLGDTEQAYISLLPSATSLALDIDTIATTAGGQTGTKQTGTGLLPSTAAAQFVGGLPGGSWLALGVGNAGATFGQSATTLRSLASLLTKLQIGTFSLQGVVTPFFSKGFDLNKDLLSWMGPAAVFAAGNGLLNLQAGIVAASNEPAASRAAVGQLAQAYKQAGAEVASTTIPNAEEAVTVRIKGFPVVVAIGAGEDRFAIGIGPASVQEALSPATTLSSSPSYQAAAATLGHSLQPSLLVEFPTAVSLIETRLDRAAFAAGTGHAERRRRTGVGQWRHACASRAGAAVGSRFSVSTITRQGRWLSRYVAVGPTRCSPAGACRVDQ